MKRESDAARLLNSLLDRLERATDRSRRIIMRAGLSFGSADAHRAFNGMIMGARDAGAVEVHFDREAPHLIDRVILADQARLYTYLDRRPPEVELNSALSRLASLKPGTEVGKALAAHIGERWTAGKPTLALTPADSDQAARLVAAADAAFTELPAGRLPLRTRSARLLGDSKALERSLSKLLTFLKQTGRVDSGLTRDEALQALGLEKYPQPLLVAGPLLVRGVPVADWTYVGLPPDAGDDFEIRDRVRSVLTIENLESFNRHVRECREPGDAVIYTGGFPSAGVVSVLARLTAMSNVPCVWHWGDIDGGGVKIAAYLERSLPVPIMPHLMTAELATAYGKAAPPLTNLREFSPASPFADLASYLSSDAAHWLEQEVLDPQPVLTST
jgi:hypothetical protein